MHACCWFGCVQLFETPWTVACQAPLSMEFSRQEYWSGLSFPSPGALSTSGCIGRQVLCTSATRETHLKTPSISKLCFAIFIFRSLSSVQSLSHVQLFATPWTAAYQAPLSTGFSRQEYWSGLPFPSPGESSRPRDRTRVSHIGGRCFNL